MAQKINGETAQHLQRKYAERIHRLPRAPSPSQASFRGLGGRESPLHPDSLPDDEYYDGPDDDGHSYATHPGLYHGGSASLTGPGKHSADGDSLSSVKRRKPNQMGDDDHSLERTLHYHPIRKGKGRREGSVDSVSTTSKGPRKKPTGRKPVYAPVPDTSDLMGLAIASTSAFREVTPAESRPDSPFGSNNIIFEIGDDPPPMRRAKKVDDGTMAKRIRNLQESQRKVWTNIARREIPKVRGPLFSVIFPHLIISQVYKYVNQGWSARQTQCKRLATLSSMQARKPFTRTTKTTKDVQTRGKRLMREMLVSWKKNEREERDFRKRENKEAADRAKVEDEKREAARQARKLEFLISQTELYSHFVGSKLKSLSICLSL